MSCITKYLREKTMGRSFLSANGAKLFSVGLPQFKLWHNNIIFSMKTK